MIDRFRETNAEPKTEAIDLSTIAVSQDDPDVELEMRALHEELAQLPITERDVLVLFYLQELTLSELAEVLAIPVGTVKSRLFRARHLLRRHLLKKGMQP